MTDAQALSIVAIAAAIGYAGGRLAVVAVLSIWAGRRQFPRG